MQEQKVDVYQERRELTQEVIDRLIYLPKYRRSSFKDKLDILIRMYPIEFREVNGVRVFEIVKEACDE
jgi:hypothetical protein